MKKRLIAVLLLMGMLLTSAACASDTGTSSDADNTASADNAAATAAETADPYDDELGTYDFEGEEFHFYTRDKTTFNDSLNITEETGDAFNDAQFKSNRMLEERFNFVFKETFEENNTANARTAVIAGDDTYDIIQTRCVYAYNYAAEGLVIPVQDLPVINLDKPYWDSKLTDEMTILGKKYFAVGDFNLTSYDFTHVLLFNKAMMRDFGLGDIYSLVKNGEWTLEKYEKMAVTVKGDVNGDGKMDANDRYGYLATVKQVLPNFWISSDMVSVEKDSDDKPIFTMTSNEKLVSLIDELFRMHWDTGMWLPSTTSHDINPEFLTMFTNNFSLFADSTCFTLNTLRAMETDFGIIPYPKYDELQEQYCARIEGCELFCVPVTNKNHEFTGVVLEAMSAESAKSVVPAYYDIALQGKITRDEESSEMLDIIFDNRVFDWGDTIWCTEIRDGIFDGMFKDNDRDLASKTAELENLVANKIKTTVETFEKLS